MYVQLFNSSVEDNPNILIHKPSYCTSNTIGNNNGIKYRVRFKYKREGK